MFIIRVALYTGIKNLTRRIPPEVFINGIHMGYCITKRMTGDCLRKIFKNMLHTHLSNAMAGFHFIIQLPGCTLRCNCIGQIWFYQSITIVFHSLAENKNRIQSGSFGSGYFQFEIHKPLHIFFRRSLFGSKRYFILVVAILKLWTHHILSIDTHQHQIRLRGSIPAQPQKKHHPKTSHLHHILLK